MVATRKVARKSKYVTNDDSPSWNEQLVMPVMVPKDGRKSPSQSLLVSSRPFLRDCL